MNNVIRLFAPAHAEMPSSESETRISTAVAEVLAVAEKLGPAIKTLSRNFNAMEASIDTVDDMEARTRHLQSIKRSREALSNALLNLIQQIGKLVTCHEA